MTNVIQEIKKFQSDRLLDKQEHNVINEATNIIEELLEIQGYSVPKEKRYQLKIEVENMFKSLINKLELKKENEDGAVDGYADIVVFCVGAIMKLGYNPECVLDEVAKEINSRTGKIINGKFQKDTSPEAVAKWYKANYDKCKMDYLTN
jgi:predicted HAD superfamily Cof-like phosphohydrolase